ncbi:MAG TPA: ATP-binding protein, partial [Kofleriaceae bacterium]|nr:ATP-binding protein [Kofleriaceae bacterium]
MIDADLGDPTEATPRRLDVACTLVNVLLARSSIDGDGFALLDELSLPAGVFVTAAAPPMVVNAAWQRLFGASSLASLTASIDEAARTGETHHVPALALEDRFAYYAVTVRPVRTGVIVVCAPVTDEVVARMLGVAATALVWGGPVGGAADFGNTAWCAYTGEPDAAGWRDRIRTRELGAAPGPVTGTEYDAWIRRADGVDRWHHVELRTSEGRWFGIATDIDAIRVDLERRDIVAHERALRLDAEQAGHRKDQFLAAVSHELRSPLTTMLLWERVLQDESADAAMRTQALEAIHQSAMSQSRLIGDLLDVSRAVSGKLHVDLRNVDIENVLRDALAAIEPIAASKQIAIERRGVAMPADVQGDDARLRQVFDNLLSNAVKFTNRGGRITIEVTRTTTSIHIAVADNGRGIAGEFLPHLFEPFSQTDDSLTRRAGG